MSANSQFLSSVSHIQTVTQGSGAAALAQAAAGTLTIADLIQQNTGAGLTSQIASSVVGDVVPLELTINDVTIVEGNSGTSTATFVIALSAPAGLPVSVNIQTADGTASAASGDYSALAMLLTYGPGETTKNVTVEISGDLVLEPNETFFLQLMAATGAHIGAFQGQATIVNDDSGAPIAHDDVADTVEDTSIAINVIDNDVDPESALAPASVTVTVNPLHGSTIVDAATGLVTYTPAAEFSGTDSFRYILRNALGLISNLATVSLVIAPVNDAPVVRNDSAATSELLPVAINVLANDSDIDGVVVKTTVAITNDPSHGFVEVNASTGAITYTPAAEFSGVDTFRYTVKDDSGAVSNAATVTVTVAALTEKSARLQADPVDSGRTALIVKGSSGNDEIRVEADGQSGRVKVTIGNKCLGVFAPTGCIIVLAGAGNDEIDADGKFAGTVEIHGGAGNDRIESPTSPSILIGGPGNDELIGGSARNLMIGGDGSDRLQGKSDSDLLIGGWTVYDSNPKALATIFAAWTRKDLDIDDRVSLIHHGLSGGFRLNSTTVFDDAKEDWLSGDAGFDWVFAGHEDHVSCQNTWHWKHWKHHH